MSLTCQRAQTTPHPINSENRLRRKNPPVAPMPAAAPFALPQLEAMDAVVDGEVERAVGVEEMPGRRRIASGVEASSRRDSRRSICGVVVACDGVRWA